MQRHPEILKAAQKLFAQYGLKKVTTDDIAREARVSKATIYKLYPNKQEILRTVIRLETEELLAKIRKAVAAQDSAEGRLRAYLLTRLRTVRELINLHALSRQSLAAFWDHAEDLRRQFVQEEAQFLEEILTAGEEAGELRIRDRRSTAHFIVLSVHTLETPWAVEGLDLKEADQVELMLNNLLNGLRRRD